MVTPALLTSMSTRPKCFSVSSARDLTSCASAISAVCVQTFDPDFRADSAVCSNSSALRAVNARSAPALEKASDIATPIPFDAPLINAIFPSREIF